MSYEVTPDQITALQSGETIKLLIRMEQQSSGACDLKRYKGPHGCTVAQFFDSTKPHPRRYKSVTCPVAVGDTVDLECDYCGGRGWTYLDNDHSTPDKHPCDCNPCDDVEYQAPWATVRSIAPAEQDDVHYWELEVSR